MQGVSLRAAVRSKADDHQGQNRLCRYMAGPAQTYEHVACDAVRPEVRKLITSWRDGTTHLVMSPLELMQ